MAWPAMRKQSPVPAPRVIPPMPPADLGGAQPSAYQATGGTRVALPGADFPPAGAIAVDQVGDLDLAPSATGTLLTIPVPPNVRFRAAGIGFGADDEAALRFLSWALLINNDPAPSGYSQQPAAIGSLRQLADIFLLVPGGSTLSVFATIAATASITYRYICRLRGWQYTEPAGGQ